MTSVLYDINKNGAKKWQGLFTRCPMGSIFLGKCNTILSAYTLYRPLTLSQTSPGFYVSAV